MRSAINARRLGLHRNISQPPKSESVPCGRAAWLLMLLVVIVGALAYSNSFRGVFLLDDEHSILNNKHIHRLWPIGEVFKAPVEQTTAGRPLLSLTFAVNWAISGDGAWSYHTVNLLVHLANALLIFALVRRTLLLPRFAGRWRSKAHWAAAVTAGLWVVHPLTTSGVTYIVQRAESMVSLFFLLTMYCALRAWSSRRAALWAIAAAASCAAGMATKEVMVGAPLVVMLYDWIFMEEPCLRIARRRWGLYLGLAMTWAILAALLSTAPRTATAGVGTHIPPQDYLLAEFKAVTHYFRLAFWPWPLSLDYYWPPVKHLRDVWPQALFILALLGGTCAGLWRRMPAAFAGAMLFAALAPSSSFVPLTDTIFEHRFYLSLALVIAVVVTGVFMLLGRLGARPRLARAAYVVAAGVLLAAATSLALLTHLRNEDYHDAVRMWESAVRVSDNCRVRQNLGYNLVKLGRREEAKPHFEKAIAYNDDWAPAYDYLALIYAGQGNLQRAQEYSESAIRRDRNLPRPYWIRGACRHSRGMYEDAAQDFQTAVQLSPDEWSYQNSFAMLLATCPDDRVRNGWRALGLARSAVAKHPSAMTLDTLAAAYAQSGDFANAVAVQRQAIQAQTVEGSGKSTGPQKLAAMREHLKLYEESQPRRDAPAAQAGAR